MFDDLKPHIADLRKRLVISSITLVIAFFACFSFYEPILTIDYGVVNVTL